MNRIRISFFIIISSLFLWLVVGKNFSLSCLSDSKDSISNFNNSDKQKSLDNQNDKTSSEIFNETNLENLDDDSFEILKLTESNRSKLPIETIQPEYLNYQSNLEITGEIQSDPDLMANIGSRLGGKLIAIHKKEGDRIKKGEIIIEMDSPEIARLQSAYISSYSKYLAAEKNHERLKDLSKMKMASDQEIRNAEAESITWYQEWKTNEQELNLNGISLPNLSDKTKNSQIKTGTRITIRSPISGTVINRFVIPGTVIDPNTNILTIADLRKVWFTGKIYEKDLATIKKGQSADVVLNSFPNDKFHGRITFIGSSIDKITGSIPARITLDNPDEKIKLGLFGKAIMENSNSSTNIIENKNSNNQSGIQSKTGSQLLHIPEKSIFQIKNEDCVFVQINDLEYKIQKVTIGHSVDGKIPVISGISLGDKIVTSGVYSLKSLYLKDTFGEDE
ncbi:efflux RND transporter periplasmic adaptor subunit [Leptospira sp. GIMC2001]|uniref:efflux RND transporter periplasmic adaptor subunit n=1 Tax=Leptospira sp. GIMC2001 TaxID=1513297 RepID=UPI002349AB3D|nr:efflux RND transporter periplasmic adaptor subunit [Leptospira sp. GIMC2001]WCL50037.1 efflux RND transporter periplasmic adaptor subunit [Leptospira sp. GIMC2001]